MITKSFEEISVGDIAVTDPRVVTEDYVRSFADLTWDRHPLHLDPDYAQQTRFGRQIAHGALMLSTLLGLVELDPVTCSASTGSIRSDSTGRLTSATRCMRCRKCCRCALARTVRPRS
ncbi:MaoC family dehydratase [Rhodococcus sp. 3Y1]